MTYHFSKALEGEFEDVIRQVTEALKQEGFGVLTEIDVQQTLKKKLNADFRKYRILGACNPTLAHQALQIEDKIGTMLPCNAVVQQTHDGSIEVSAVDPVASMQAVGNAELISVAETVREKMRAVIETL
jgi:uncharacterized protein (DUF302 family)